LICFFFLIFLSFVVDMLLMFVSHLSRYSIVCLASICQFVRLCTYIFVLASGVTRDSGAPRQIFKWGPPFFVIFFIIHTIPHDIRVKFKFKLKFIGVCCCNAATKHSMVWIVMPTFYCNYFFLLGTRWPLTLGGPLDFAYPAYPIVTPLVLASL